MPRRGSSGFGSRGSSPRYSSRSSFANTRPQPQFVQPTRQPGMFSGLGSTLATGMAFGAGSAIAHQAIRGIMGPNYQTVYVQPLPGQTPE